MRIGIKPHVSKGICGWNVNTKQSHFKNISLPYGLHDGLCLLDYPLIVLTYITENMIMIIQSLLHYRGAQILNYILTL